ncbi:MAG TPA: RNA methyltransferase [Terriglobales bacterium]|nr:RNA methyltransferase [Terriglobales bacterium]
MAKKTTRKSSVLKGRLRRIEGRHNSLLKELRSAFARGERAGGCCAIEGLRIIEEAIRSGLKFKAVFFSESAAARAERLLPQIGAHVETLLVPDRLLASAVPSETPQGIAALVYCKEFSLEDVLAKAEAGPVLVIAGVQDPGNLGTILRSAEAFGAGGVILGEGSVSPFNSKVIRASAGSLFRLAVAKAEMKTAIAALRARGTRLLATSSHKGTPLPDAQVAGPLAIFVGSEGAGLPRELMAEMDEVLVIPHSLKVESLNAGVAASIVLYEIARGSSPARQGEAEENSFAGSEHE